MIYGMRFGNLDLLDTGKLLAYTERFGSPKIFRAVDRLVRTTGEDEEFERRMWRVRAGG